MRDDYDVFLNTWTPSDGLKQATLPHYLWDRMMLNRALQDYQGTAEAIRSQYVSGTKEMNEDERSIRAYDFFVSKQPEWAEDFRDRLLQGDIPTSKVDGFIDSFAKDWVDGHRRRQRSANMLGIKRSIYDLYISQSQHSNRFVYEGLDESIAAFFTTEEMQIVFATNDGMTQTYMADYIDALDGQGATSLGTLYVRRGVYMPGGDIKILKEKNYLSSYSLALGPIEQFAQTWTPDTKQAGKACMFSSPLAAIQNRIVAFAPFIEGMDLGQMEFVVAPPVEEFPLTYHGNHGGIEEYSFS